MVSRPSRGAVGLLSVGLIMLGNCMMEIAMNRHTAGQFAQSVGQTKTARWMRWQTNRFTSANQQMLAMADKGVSASRSTHCNWRAGGFPEGFTLIDLVGAYPSLHLVFWPDSERAKSLAALERFDRLERDLQELREML